MLLEALLARVAAKKLCHILPVALPPTSSRAPRQQTSCPFSAHAKLFQWLLGAKSHAWI
ncbi:hypothetical protein BS78_01G232400 [Paspalum vaginatum]|nr:hypothetical protein BS78_01G232400 [Paspalum vaginatum]